VIFLKIIENILKKIFFETVEKTYGKEIAEKVYIQETNNSVFGDYQTNFAMITSKDLRQAPRKTAESLIENIQNNEIIEKLEIAGPGFINIYLKKEFLIEMLLKVENEKYDFEINTDGEVIIDYSSPNIAKEMHIGHLRSTIIGDSIKKIMQFMGYKVIGDNHIGDWGTQFGKLIVAYKNWLDENNYKENAIDELERLYVLFSQKAEEDDSLNTLAKDELKKLQDGDEENTRLWKEFVSVSLEEYDKVYKRLGIHFDTYNGESFYHDLMKEVIDLMEEKKLVKESEGALVVEFDEKDNLPTCIVRKSNKSFLYTTSDIACIKYRRENYNINKLVYVTDQRQQMHFKQVFKIAEMLGFNEEKAHVYFGLMRFADGVFSTRKGNVIKLKELLDKAKEKALEILKERNSTGNLEEKAEIIGMGAVKYADLSQNRTSDIIFEWDKILSFSSNSSPYLQYTYARINSLTKKSQVEIKEEIKDLQTDFEINLAKMIVKFPSAILKAAESYKPNVLSDYLYNLAQTFNSFYNNVPVLKSEEEELNTRIYLCYKTARIIKKGLELLGIKTLEEM
jgi:arginyl-tRNA synthetase